MLYVSSHTNDSKSRWEPPNIGHGRLDIDVGFDESKGKLSIGAIIRDHSGQLVAASSRNIRIRWGQSKQ